MKKSKIKPAIRLGIAIFFASSLGHAISDDLGLHTHGLVFSPDFNWQQSLLSLLICFSIGLFMFWGLGTFDYFRMTE